MLSESDVRKAIKDRNRYNFRDLLENGAQQNHEQLTNTLELYAFGNYATYLANRQAFIDLDHEEIYKLIELSILTVLNQNVGNDVGLQDLLLRVQPVIDTYESVESLLINMSDAGAVQIKIDGENDVVFVTDTPKLRDAYNPDKHTLRVLTAEAVQGSSVQRARQLLTKWLNEKVIPNSQ